MITFISLRYLVMLCKFVNSKVSITSSYFFTIISLAKASSINHFKKQLNAA